MIEVEPNTLGETAKALLWVIGALLAGGGGGYFLGNKRKVQLEPNRVEVAPDALTQLRENLEGTTRQLREDLEGTTRQLRTELTAHITDCAKRHETIELRLSRNEREVAEIKGQLPHINQSLHRIEGKIDALMGKVRL